MHECVALGRHGTWLAAKEGSDGSNAGPTGGSIGVVGTRIARELCTPSCSGTMSQPGARARAARTRYGAGLALPHAVSVSVLDRSHHIHVCC